MIYSCTMFYNEWRLLYLKQTEEVGGGVDRIFMSEAGETFSGKKKDRLLKEQLAAAPWRHSPFIEIVEVDNFDAATHENPAIRAFQREAIQRNAPMKALLPRLKDDDVVICTDIDEIFPADDIKKIAAETRIHGIVHCIIKQFLYKINLHHFQPYYGAFAALGHFFKHGLTINRLRTMQGQKMHTNGKHFEYLGLSPAGVAKKMGDFAHISFDKPEFTDETVLRKAMEEYRDPYGRGIRHTPVVVDDSYPQAILKKLAHWDSYIEPGATARLEDFQELEVAQFSPVNPLDDAVYEAINSVETS